MRNNIKIFNFILLLFCFCNAVIGNMVKVAQMDNLSIVGGIGLCQFVFSIWNWRKLGNKLLSPYIVFLTTLYLFSFGQSFLYPLGIETERTLIGFYGITEDEIFRAQILTLQMLAFFQIGANLRVKKEDTTIYYDSNPYGGEKLKRIGWFLFIVSVVPYMTETINDLVISMSKGYGAIYGNDKIGIDNMAGIIADYFIPSIICLFIAYRNNAIVRYFLIGIMLINVVAIMLIGGRSNAVILLALVIILQHYLIKEFSKKWLFVGAVGSVFLLQLLAFVGASRTDSNRSINDKVELSDNAAVEAIAEMGGSMFCLIKTMNIVPAREDYRYGKSYAYAFTTIIPNVGLWDIHPAKKESNIGEWLTASLGLTYGTGYSMCAEAYINFGYFGILVFLIWGYFIATLFGKIENKVQSANYVLLAFLLILFWFFLKLPRNNFINLVRPIFFIAGPIYLYCNNFKLRRQ